MGKLFKKVLEILDGTPAEYSKPQKQRGQSLVELALVTPLLLILIAGLAEVGWYARNYLDIMEITRVGARLGTVQQNETSPLFWDNGGSVLPDPGSISTTEYENFLRENRNCSPDDPSARIGFYNLIACVMIRSMDPMPFRDSFPDADGPDVQEDGSPYPDDIVISAFAIQAIHPLNIPGGLVDQIDLPLNNRDTILHDDVPLSPTAPQLVVVGRYPTNANECSQLGERDPFDYIQDGERTRHPLRPGEYLELEGFDPLNESQRGYVWTGQHVIEGTNCLGSEWSIRDVERMVNLQGFGMHEGVPASVPDGRLFGRDDVDLRGFVPSQGIILVEMHWHHVSLTHRVGFGPALSPVLGVLGETTTISVWSAFPLPAVEPNIRF